MTTKDLFNKKHVFNIALIILSLIIAYNIYKQQAKEIKLLQQQKQDAIGKNRLLGDISQFERKMDAYKNVLSAKDTGMVINIFSKIAEDTGVKIIGIRPLPEQRFAGYTKIPFDLVLNVPSFHALGKFTSKIESYREVFMVESLDMRSGAQVKDLNVTAIISQFAVTN